MHRTVPAVWFLSVKRRPVIGPPLSRTSFAAVMTESEPTNYESKAAVPPVPRVWGLSLLVWLLVAGFCGFVEFAGAFATNGRVNGWCDVAFIVVFAVVGVVAFINVLRLLWRAG